MASLATGLISSLVGGIFGRPRSQTQTSQSTSTQTNDPIYGPKGQKLAKVSANTLIDFIRNPNINEGLRVSGRKEINDIYGAQQSRLDSILAGRGFGNSGKANLNTVSLERGRAGAMGDYESKLYQDALDRQFQALGLGTAYGKPIGFNTTTETQSQGTTPGMPMGQAIGGALGNFGNDLSGYMLFNNLLKNQRSGSSGGGAPFGGYGSYF